MLEMTDEIVLYLLGAGLVGLVVGWLLRSQMGSRRIKGLNDEWQVRLDDVIRQRDRFTVEIDKLKTSIETQQGVVHRHEVSASRVT